MKWLHEPTSYIRGVRQGIGPWSILALRLVFALLEPFLYHHRMTSRETGPALDDGRRSSWCCIRPQTENDSGVSCRSQHGRGMLLRDDHEGPWLDPQQESGDIFDFAVQITQSLILGLPGRLKAL